ncbi:MAG: mRNA surveillance protein pelota [Candidatus Micrarchaeota archaeon]|nr:mRNA surveillance protein pelota [Candidatus Micrarchaeota archaeon]MDE1834107.1 mRNA surveillance protein pelota [Candidatus Micrarchaeota archaeon]MDE1859341.1 mRNA surveillance protein pelota [Candidatus Micrarchaeota archaeon]
MRVVRFNDVTNSLKAVPESFDDLYLLAMITSTGDSVEAKSTRRFRPSEGDKGEQKDVMIRITVEKTEIDKNAGRLRLSGKITFGRPEEFVTIGSYHTLNIGAGDVIDIQKPEWKRYILARIKQAVAQSKKPRLGIIVLDDEKAMVSYIKGYGIDIVSELYSRLSKKMKEKDYEKQREQYFNDIINAIKNMSVDMVVLAGPGFTKEDIKKYMENKDIETGKRLVYAPASDAERSGIREAMQSEAVAKVLENEHVKREFSYLNEFMAALRTGSAFHGVDPVKQGIDNRKVGVVLVNDSVLNDESVKSLLDYADMRRVKIEIFNSDDDAGMQLRNFQNIVGLPSS